VLWSRILQGGIIEPFNNSVLGPAFFAGLDVIKDDVLLKRWLDTNCVVCHSRESESSVVFPFGFQSLIEDLKRIFKGKTRG